MSDDATPVEPTAESAEEAAATEPVLSDEEKDALLAGVASGAVEVLTGGEQQYADVQPFKVNPRSQIRRNSFPRLQILNEQLADRLKKHTETSLQSEVAIAPGDIIVRPYSEICARVEGLSAVTLFKAPPLEGLGGIVVDAETINQIVEGFFGGGESAAGAKQGDAFSAGELSICRMFCNAVLSNLKDAWEPVTEVTTETVGMEVGMDLVDIAADTDRVIAIEFSTAFAHAEGHFQLLFPLAMLQPLLPIFEGQKSERDAAEDARWERCLRAHLPDANVRLTGRVGAVTMPLRQLRGLQPGDVLNIEDPGRAMVIAGDVPVVLGRFGVHAGLNAVETERWATH